MTFIAQAAKACFAALVAFLTGLSTSLSADSGFGDVTDQQWVFIVLGTIVAFGGVYGISNRPSA